MSPIIHIQSHSLVIMNITLPHISKQTIIPSKTHSIRCIVYLYHSIGRLGNRMFHIASVYGLARLHSCNLYLPPLILREMKSIFIFDLQPFLLSTSTFNSMMSKKFANSMTKINKYVGCQYIPELKRPNAISQGTIFELKGFWQSYLHFAKYGNELRERIFVATKPINDKVSKLFIDLYQQKLGFRPQFSIENHQSFKKQLNQLNWTTWIGIHVRRSDFIGLGYSSSDAYLFRAIDYYILRYPNAHFILASDDKSYCRNLFHNRSNIFITPETFSIGDDLITLSVCEHSIITGGSFGWWTGYLTNGEVVHDTTYPHGCKKDEHYYPPWFRTNVDIVVPKYTL